MAKKVYTVNHVIFENPNIVYLSMHREKNITKDFGCYYHSDVKT